MWKCKICHFYTFTGSDFWFFMNFCNLWRLKRTKSKKLKALKMAKTAVLELLDSPKLISRKIWMREKFSNFHIVNLLLDMDEKRESLQKPSPKVGANIVQRTSEIESFLWPLKSWVRSLRPRTNRPFVRLKPLEVWRNSNTMPASPLPNPIVPKEYKDIEVEIRKLEKEV